MVRNEAEIKAFSSGLNKIRFNKKTEDNEEEEEDCELQIMVCDITIPCNYGASIADTDFFFYI